MKKQILILTFFVAALLAGTSNVFAQEYPVGPSTVLPAPMTSCTDSALHPIPGISYTYEVTTTTGDPVPADGYIWWVTKNPNFIDSVAASPTFGLPDTTSMLNVQDGELISASSPYGIAATGAGSSIDITWSPDILAATDYQGDVTNWQTATALAPTPTFVAVTAWGDCTNNLEVYEINPKPAFTVDIANIDGNGDAMGYGVDTSQCVSPVYSARYNNTTKELDMNYGWDTLYFEVVAANFADNYLPQFYIEDGSILEDQTIDFGWAATLDSARNGLFIETEITDLTTADIGTGASADTIRATTPISGIYGNTVNGVSIWVRAVIHNNTYELDGDDGPNAFTLTVDGQDATGQWDLVNATCVDPGAPDGNDQAVHNITPRPTINDVTADPDPDPDTFITKTQQ